MIVPEFWAEARRHHRDGKRQITVRRFGWSNESESDALALAESRAAEALARLLAGEKIDRRETKAAYNGALGVPIREEVLSRHGEEVITRNAYGAHCLNTPRALFADIDFEQSPRAKDVFIAFGALTVASALVGVQGQRWGLALGLMFISLFLSSPVASFAQRTVTAWRGGASQIARRRITAFLSGHPTWNLRLYKTPAGLRLLATHQPFDPAAPDVQQFFTAVGADPVYVRMCLNQHCFRARLSAKPWRIGIAGRMRPRPGIWPVDPARRHLRETWVASYEQKASGFAACQFLESLGSGAVHDELRPVIELHDRESKAREPHLPLA